MYAVEQAHTVRSEIGRATALALVRLLLKNGANRTLKDAAETTTLQYAEDHADTEIAALLR